MDLRHFIRRLIPTLHEDEHLIAVSKPAGLDAGGGPQRPPGGLAEIVVAIRARSEDFEAANRLGRFESGIQLFAKDRETARHLRAGLRSNRVAQTYLAVVLGRMDRSPMLIEAAHGSSKGKRRSSDSRRPARRGGRPPRAERGSADTRRQGEDKPTEVRLLRSSAGRSLVRLRTTVATTHALRAQLRSAGLRLAGDSLHDRSHRRRSPNSVCLHLERISFHAPHVKTKLTVTCPVPAGFAAVMDGEIDVERPLLAAMVRRLPFILASNTDSYRLVTGTVEDLQGCVAEKYGPFVVLQVRGGALETGPLLKTVARWYRHTLGCEAVYAKRFPKTGSGRDQAAIEELCSPRPLLGKTMPQQTEIREKGLRFGVKPYDGSAVGLYLDHRDNRTRVRSLSKGKDVLNLFAYTCGFSVAAAAGGAASVTSVDISNKNLQWGRTNLELNGLDGTPHRFVASDAFDFLKRARRETLEFDLIIVDPPTFAHGRRRKKSFSIARDLPNLITQALAVLRPGGTVMLSTNHRRVSSADLSKQLRAGAGRRRFEVTATPRLPLDFSMDPDHAKTIFARFD